MTIDEMKKGYAGEIAYQKHMLRNLGYWFQLCIILSAAGIVLIHFTRDKILWGLILGIVLLIVGALGMLLFGYAGWRGQRNVRAIAEDFEKKLAYLQRKN